MATTPAKKKLPPPPTRQPAPSKDFQEMARLMGKGGARKR